MADSTHADYPSLNANGTRSNGTAGGLKDSIVRAVEMARPERRRRMRALRKRVRENDVAHWSREFLRTLAEHSRGGDDPLGELEWTVEREPRS